MFSAHIAIDNLLPTLKPPAAPNVIMASNKSPDLINVGNKNGKLAALHDGTLLSNPRILKAFLSKFSFYSQITAQVVKWFISGKWFIGYNFDKDDGAESNFGTHYRTHRL